MSSTILGPLTRWFYGKENKTERQGCMKLPDSVPAGVQEAYRQACFLLSYSPRASGTLARYGLQQMLRDFWTLIPEEQGTLAAEFDLVSVRLSPESRQSVELVRRFGAIESQLSLDRDMMVETTAEEAKLLIALLQLLSFEWYEERRRRLVRVERIRAMVEEAEAKQAREATPAPHTQEDDFVSAAQGEAAPLQEAPSPLPVQGAEPPKRAQG